MKIIAVGTTRNEADIIRINVLHHLSQGVDEFIWLDNGSSDGTDLVLQEMSRTLPVEWRPHSGPFQQQELLTALAREAYIRGADWVLPLDADEFWHAPGGTLRDVLSHSPASALRVSLVNFVQSRDQLRPSAEGLRFMTRRPAQSVGPIEEIANLVETKRIAFVEIMYPPKWIVRASPSFEIGWGSHTIYGVAEPLEDTAAIVCLHAPLRSRATLERKVDAARPTDDLHEYLEQAWHVRRWRRIAAEDGLEREWNANSYDGTLLDLYGTPRPLVIDTRLSELVEPWIGTSTKEPAADAETDGVQASKAGFPSIRRFPEDVRLWGVSAVCDAADVIETNVRYHLSLGLDKLLIVDLGSSDGTQAALARLTDPKVEWKPATNGGDSGDELSRLLREAASRGATWVLPIEADAFWMSKSGSLREVLAQSDSGVLFSQLVTFVQHRDEHEADSHSLLRMTMRSRRAIGPPDDALEPLSTGAVSWVETAQRRRWIARATPWLQVDAFERLSGTVGDFAPIESLTCLRAPLRARSVLVRAARTGRAPTPSWPTERWRRLAATDALDAEWVANSHLDGRLGGPASERPLVNDDRLRSAVLPFVGRARVAVSEAPVAPPPRIPRASISPGSPSWNGEDSYQHGWILDRMRPIEGWLTDAEAALLTRAVAQAVDRFGDESAIVEIGSYCGKSTVVIASTIARSRSRQVVHAIDPHFGQVGAVDSPVGLVRAQDTWSVFTRNIAALGLTDYVTPVRRRSFEVDWCRSIGFLFVDGLHDVGSVRQDGDRYCPWVRRGAFAVFHDYSDLFPGVIAYVDSMIQSGEFQTVARADALIVLERVGEPASPRSVDVTEQSVRASVGGTESPLGVCVPSKEPPDDHAINIPARSLDLLETELDRYALRLSQADLLADNLREQSLRQGALVADLTVQLDQSRSQTPSCESATERERRSAIIEALDERLRQAREQESALRRDVDRHGQMVAAAEDRLATAIAERDEATSLVTSTLAPLERQLAQVVAERDALLSSLSWRCTAPIRSVYDVCLRLARYPASERHAGRASRFLVGAVRKGLTAWREGRLEASPVQWVRHLRSYRRELALRNGFLTDAPAVEPVVSLLEYVQRVAPRAENNPRFLIFSDAVPRTDSDSGSFRMFQIVRLLQELRYDVTFVSHSAADESSHAARLESLGVQVIRGEQRALAHLSSDGAAYQVVLISRPEVAAHYLFPVRAHAIHASVVYDSVDLHWVRMTRAAEVTGDKAWLDAAEEFRRLEHFAAEHSDLALTVTQTEKEVLLAELPNVRVEVLPNIHPINALQTPWSKRQGLMFIGGFWHHPNEDAVIYFVEQILPLVRRELPDIEFTIIGTNMPNRITALASKTVRPLGYVPDLTDHFATARVFVAPLRYGAGMKGKIGHSMSYGLPVVTTSIGAEGMWLVDGDTALIADSVEGFARAVVRLYTDQQLWQHVAGRSVSHVAEHFSDETVRHRLAEMFPVSVEQA